MQKQPNDPHLLVKCTAGCGTELSFVNHISNLRLAKAGERSMTAFSLFRLSYELLAVVLYNFFELGLLFLMSNFLTFESNTVTS